MLLALEYLLLCVSLSLSLFSSFFLSFSIYLSIYPSIYLSIAFSHYLNNKCIHVKLSLSLSNFISVLDPFFNISMYPYLSALIYLTRLSICVYLELEASTETCINDCETAWARISFGKLGELGILF